MKHRTGPRNDKSEVAALEERATVPGATAPQFGDSRSLRWQQCAAESVLSASRGEQQRLALASGRHIAVVVSVPRPLELRGENSWRGVRASRNHNPPERQSAERGCSASSVRPSVRSFARSLSRSP